MRLPDLRGKTVLDVGAWDGFYSFHAEERGAARVVALDYHTWGWEPTPHGPAPGQPDPERLPGRCGFDLARRMRGSRVEPVVGDFMTMDLDALGRFRVVLLPGVLHHLEDPLGALRRLRRVTGELAVIETHGVHVPQLEHRNLWQFYPGAELADDPTNWWGPNARALISAAGAAGFDEVELVWTQPVPQSDEVASRRMMAHARPDRVPRRR